MVRTTFRVALIAAAILVVTMVAAFADTQLGLIDLYTKYYNIPLPKSAQNVLNAIEQKTYSVGPLNITLRETIADGHVAYLTTQAKTKDGSIALISGDNSKRIPDSESNRLNLPKYITLVEAAKQANIPLYVVSSYLTIDKRLTFADDIQICLWAEDGSALLVDMLRTYPPVVPETLVGSLTLRVRQMDPDTSSFVEGKDWQTTENISIPVNGVIAKKTYTPDGEAQLKGYTVQSIEAVQTCTGIYLTVSIAAGEGISQEDVLFSFSGTLHFKNAQGENFPRANYWPERLSYLNWPIFTLDIMISIDALPDTIQMSSDGSSITLR